MARFGDNLKPDDIPRAYCGDVNTPYRCIGGAIYTMQQAGFVKVGFISEPPAGTAVGQGLTLRTRVKTWQ